MKSHRTVDEDCVVVEMRLDRGGVVGGQMKGKKETFSFLK
jgi:hypothetical protein